MTRLRLRPDHRRRHSAAAEQASRRTRFAVALLVLPLLASTGARAQQLYGPEADAPGPARQAITEQAREAMLDEARALVGAQRYPEAISALNRYLSLVPDDLEATQELARVLSWTKAYQDALLLYGSLLKLLPDDAEIKLEHAKVLTWAGRYDEAVVALEALRAAVPVAMAPASAATDHHVQATTDPSMQARTDPNVQATADPNVEVSPALASNGPDARTERVERALADAYRWSGRTDQALPLYDRLWSLHPDDQELGLMFARALAERQVYTRAIQVYDRLLQDGLDSYELRIERARVLLWAVHYADGLEALRDLRKDLLEARTRGDDVDPGMLDEVARLLASGYAWSQDFTRADQEYATLVVNHPTDADLKLEYARVLHQLKRMDAALELYDQYLAMRPGDLTVGIERAQVLLWAARYPEAIKAFLKLEARLEDPAKSAEITDVERRRYAGDLERMLTRAYLWSGKPGEALPHLRGLFEKSPADAELALELARALAQAGRYRQARETYTRYRALGGTAASAAFGAGQTWQWEGDALRARRAYLAALEDSPPSQEAAAALAGLEPDLRWPAGLEFRGRFDSDGFGQRGLVLRGEMPVGLVWLGPELEVDRFGGGPAMLRVAPLLRARYRYTARWQLRGEAGVQLVPLAASTPLTPRLAGAVRWVPAPAVQLELEAGLSDAVAALFTRKALEERVQQAQASGTVNWQVSKAWQAWAQARAARLYGPADVEDNAVVQGQAVLERTFSTRQDTPQLRAGIALGGLHADHVDPAYWSPALYAAAGARAGVTITVLDEVRIDGTIRAGGAYSTDISRFFPEIAIDVAAGQQVNDRLSWRLEAGFGSTVRVATDESPVDGSSYWSGRVGLQGEYRF